MSLLLQFLEALGKWPARVVNPKNKIVKIPPYLVEDAIRTAPPKLFLAGRTPNNDIVLESNRVGFTTFGEGVFVIDPYTGELRKSTKKDVADAAKLADYLSEIDVYERAIEHAVRDMVYVAKSQCEAGADGINFDTVGASGNPDFKATLLAVEALKKSIPIFVSKSAWRVSLF